VWSENGVIKIAILLNSLLY